MRITDIVLTRVHGHYHGPQFPLGDMQITQLALYPPLSPGRVREPAGGARSIHTSPSGVYDNKGWATCLQHPSGTPSWTTDVARTGMHPGGARGN